MNLLKLVPWFYPSQAPCSRPFSLLISMHVWVKNHRGCYAHSEVGAHTEIKQINHTHCGLEPGGKEREREPEGRWEEMGRAVQIPVDCTVKFEFSTLTRWICTQLEFMWFVCSRTCLGYQQHGRRSPTPLPASWHWKACSLLAWSVTLDFWLIRS